MTGRVTVAGDTNRPAKGSNDMRGAVVIAATVAALSIGIADAAHADGVDQRPVNDCINKAVAEFDDGIADPAIVARKALDRCTPIILEGVHEQMKQEGRTDTRAFEERRADVLNFLLEAAEGQVEHRRNPRAQTGD
jgi:hypothetical protein